MKPGAWLLVLTEPCPYTWHIYTVLWFLTQCSSWVLLVSMNLGYRLVLGEVQFLCLLPYASYLYMYTSHTFHAAYGCSPSLGPPSGTTGSGMPVVWHAAHLLTALRSQSMEVMEMVPEMNSTHLRSLRSMLPIMGAEH